MNASYWWGVATPFLVALALAVLAFIASTAVWLWNRHVRPLTRALWLLTPYRQRQVLANWGKRRGGVTIGYQWREVIYGFEWALDGERSPAPERGEDWGRGTRAMFAFMRWGWLPLLAAEVPRLAAEYRAIEAANAREREVEKERWRREAAEREAHQQAVTERVRDLLGVTDGDPETVRHIDFGSAVSGFRRGLDEVVFLPAVTEHELDPNRPNVLVRSPAIAAHVFTGPWPRFRAYASGRDGRYDGIDPLTRLRAARPDLFEQEEDSAA